MKFAVLSERYRDDFRVTISIVFQIQVSDLGEDNLSGKSDDMLSNLSCEDVELSDDPRTPVSAPATTPVPEDTAKLTPDTPMSI